MKEVSICLQDKEGIEYKENITAEQIGEIFINLETTRDLMGHKNIRSTLQYTHGLDGLPAFAFIKEIILREGRTK